MQVHLLIDFDDDTRAFSGEYRVGFVGKAYSETHP